MKKANNSIATKLQVNFPNNCEKKLKIFLMHDKIQWLNYVVHYLNMKMKWKSAEIIDLKLCSPLK